MRIEGLNEEQIWIADILYACETIDEYHHVLMHVFDDRQRRIAQVIAQLMIHEHLEETVMAECDHYESYPDAELIIEKIKDRM